jgi:hypothetical protein
MGQGVGELVGESGGVLFRASVEQPIGRRLKPARTLHQLG